MVQYMVRRCDLCASEILGEGGPDICLVCKLCMEDDPAFFSAEALESPPSIEPCMSTAIIGRVHQRSAQLIAANDDKGFPTSPWYLRQKTPWTHVREFDLPEVAVQRLVEGLRSISRRRLRK